MQHFARQAAVLGLAKEKVVKLKDAVAIANANGKLLGQERIPAEVVDEVMAEMTASKE
jgi:hypothetical protein